MCAWVCIRDISSHVIEFTYVVAPPPARHHMYLYTSERCGLPCEASDMLIRILDGIAIKL